MKKSCNKNKNAERNFIYYQLIRRRQKIRVLCCFKKSTGKIKKRSLEITIYRTNLLLKKLFTSKLVHDSSYLKSYIQKYKYD